MLYTMKALVSESVGQRHWKGIPAQFEKVANASLTMANTTIFGNVLGILKRDVPQ